MIPRLMIPRYEVIADYPGMTNRKTGDIILFTDALWQSELPQYPHLFRKLQWWHHRKPNELPAYIGYKNAEDKFKWVAPIVKWLQTGVHEEGLCIISLTNLQGEYEERDQSVGCLSPATLTEYETYLKSKP